MVLFKEIIKINIRASKLFEKILEKLFDFGVFFF